MRWHLSPRYGDYQILQGMGQGLSALVWGSVRARVEFHYNLHEYKNC